jgi:hypothetical protein
MRTIQHITYALVIVTLTACGGGGGSDGGGSGDNKSTYSGQAFDAAIAGATVTVRTLNGMDLATTTTESDGTFSIRVPNGHDYLIFEVGQGSYTEQATGNRVHLAGEVLSAVVEPRSGQRTVSVNILSHLMAGVFLHDRENVFDFDGPAFDEAVTAVEGYSQIPPTATRLKDLAAVSSVSSIDDSVKGSLFSAAVSQFVEDRIDIDGYTGMQTGGSYSSIAFSQLLYQDVLADGKLDGQGSTGQLSFGALNIESNTYRDGLALAMVGFVRSSDNRSGIAVSNMLDYATHLSAVQNNDTAVLFSNQSPEPISGIEPTISNLAPEDQEPAYGMTQFTFDVMDFAGIQSVEFTFGNNPTETTSNFENPAFTVDTTQYADGTYPVVIEATNLSGNTATETIDVIVSNEGTTISNLDPGEGGVVRGTYQLEADMYDPVGIDYRYFYIDGDQQTGLTQTGTGYAKDIDTTIYSDGAHDFRVYAQNSVGDETEKTVSFTIDNTAPAVSNYPVDDGEFLDGQIQFAPSVTDPNGVARTALIVDGTQVATGLHNAAYTLDSSVYDEGEHTIRFEAEDSVGNLTVIEDVLQVDNQPPTVDIYFPEDGHTATSSFTAFWSIEDEGTAQDNSDNPDCGRPADFDGTHYAGCTYLYVGGTIYSGSYLQEQDSRSININNRPSGWNEIRVVAVDLNGTEAEDTISVNFQPE